MSQLESGSALFASQRKRNPSGSATTLTSPTPLALPSAPALPVAQPIANNQESQQLLQALGLAGQTAARFGAFAANVRHRTEADQDYALRQANGWAALKWGTEGPALTQRILLGEAFIDDIPIDQIDEWSIEAAGALAGPDASPETIDQMIRIAAPGIATAIAQRQLAVHDADIADKNTRIIASASRANTPEEFNEHINDLMVTNSVSREAAQGMMLDTLNRFAANGKDDEDHITRFNALAEVLAENFPQQVEQARAVFKSAMQSERDDAAEEVNEDVAGFQNDHNYTSAAVAIEFAWMGGEISNEHKQNMLDENEQRRKFHVKEVQQVSLDTLYRGILSKTIERQDTVDADGNHVEGWESAILRRMNIEDKEHPDYISPSVAQALLGKVAQQSERERKLTIFSAAVEGTHPSSLSPLTHAESQRIYLNETHGVFDGLGKLTNSSALWHVLAKSNFVSRDTAHQIRGNMNNDDPESFREVVGLFSKLRASGDSHLIDDIMDGADRATKHRIAFIRTELDRNIAIKDGELDLLAIHAAGMPIKPAEFNEETWVHNDDVDVAQKTFDLANEYRKTFDGVLTGYFFSRETDTPAEVDWNENVLEAMQAKFAEYYNQASYSGIVPKDDKLAYARRHTQAWMNQNVDFQWTPKSQLVQPSLSTGLDPRWRLGSGSMEEIVVLMEENGLESDSLIEMMPWTNPAFDPKEINPDTGEPYTLADKQGYAFIIRGDGGRPTLWTKQKTNKDGEPFLEVQVFQNSEPVREAVLDGHTLLKNRIAEFDYNNYGIEPEGFSPPPPLGYNELNEAIISFESNSP